MSIFKKLKIPKLLKKSGGVLSASATREVRQMPDNYNEKCVCCGKDSGVPHGTPIAERKYYIQGSGQLCGSCYYKLYIQKPEDEHTMTLDEMHKLIRMSTTNENRE